MRHTITVTVEVDSKTRNRAHVIDALISHITDLQGQEFNSCEVEPDGSETNQRACTLTVASAESEGQKSTAGWAVVL